MASIVPDGETQSTAYQLVPLASRGVGLAVEVVAISLGVIGFLVMCLRTSVRFGSSMGFGRSWGLEDILAIIGSLTYTAAIVFAVYAARYGLGTRDQDLPSPLYQIRAAEYLLYWEVLYLISSSILKCAVGCICLRLDPRKRIAIPISINMSIVVVVAILALIYIFASCRPLAATWNPSLGTCQETLGQATFSYLVFVTQLLTDWICVIIPSIIVYTAHVRHNQKVLISGFLGLGALASISACFRVPYLRYIDIDKYPEDYLYHLGIINISSNIECGLGIIACSLSPLDMLCRCFDSSRDRQYKYTGDNGSIIRRKHSALKLDLLNKHAGVYHASASRASHGRELDGDDDASSLRGIIMRTEVRVVSSS